ncbi:MAG: DNA methylase [Lachnospiraceae bacterium]|nr:DNA methylase [Lachnospiraceae bacterium]
MEKRVYASIDLKSFYASVECVERGLDPFDANLVVADSSRTEKTICLAVSPALKSYGVPGRPRLFEVISTIKAYNGRIRNMTETSAFKSVVDSDLGIGLEFIAAKPRMSLYMKKSAEIYNIYLKYVSSDDIFPYSIDEVFMDITDYLNYYNMSGYDFVRKMMNDVYETTGITATAGIGDNMYLAKIAMDIRAKHMKADKNGLRIAELTERSFREELWGYKPLTAFWGIGRGYAEKLAHVGLYTMGDIARCSIGKENDFYNEDLLYDLFGVNAEILIDHAWGYDPCTIKDVKQYKPQSKSVNSGQVLQCAYDNTRAEIIVREMAENLSYELMKKKLMTKKIVLMVGYDIDNMDILDDSYEGEIVKDRYGRLKPKHSRGTANLDEYTYISSDLIDAFVKLYHTITDSRLLMRRLTLVADDVINEDEVKNIQKNTRKQLSFFDDFDLSCGNSEDSAEYSGSTVNKDNDKSSANVDEKADNKSALNTAKKTDGNVSGKAGYNVNNQTDTGSGDYNKNPRNGIKTKSAAVSSKENARKDKNNKDINVECGKADSKEKLKRLQSTLLSLKSKYGSNILVKGTSLEEGATGMERNGQVGGHKA